MADTATLPLEEVTNNPRKKGGKSRRALKDLTTNEANISAGKTTSGAGKEKGVGIAVVLSPTRSRAAPKSKAAVVPARSFTDDLEELQARLDQLRLEKEKTDEMLKERDEMLKQKEEELENRGKEQERLQEELKKLQQLKEFKPTVSLSIFQSLREKEQEKKETTTTKKKKKNKDCAGKWKNISAEEKKPYELEKYQQDKEAYLQVVGHEKRENEAMELLEEEQMQRTAMELLEQYLQFRQEAENVKKEEGEQKKILKPEALQMLKKKQKTDSIINILKRAPYEEMVRKQQEEHLQEKEELHKQKKVEVYGSKQEALQMLKKKEKTDNIIREEEQKAKETRQNKKKQKREKNSDPNKPKKPASSFNLFSKEARCSLLKERPGVDNSTLNALVLVKWKELSETERKVWNDKAAEAMQVYIKSSVASPENNTTTTSR